MERIKRFLLRTSEAPGFIGFLLAFLIGLMITLIYSVIRFGWDASWGQFAPGLLLSVLAGTVLGIVMKSIRHENIARVSDYDKGDFNPDFLLRVKRGRVLAVGTALWDRKNVRAIELSGGSLYLFGSARLEAKEAGTKGWIDFEISVRMRKLDEIRPHGLPYAFDPQQVYDHVLKDRRNKGSVSTMISREFERQVLGSKTVQSVIKKYRHEPAAVLAKRLVEAIKKVRFKLPFNNMAEVAVEVEFEAPALEKVRYGQY